MQLLKSRVSGKFFLGGEHGKRGSAVALASSAEAAEELELVLAAAPELLLLFLWGFVVLVWGSFHMLDWFQGQ